MSPVVQFIIYFLCFTPCLCDRQRLLVQQARLNFMEMENDLWNLTEDDLTYKPIEAAEIYLAKKFNDFDEMLKLLPQDPLYGMEPLREFREFLYFYSDLKIIDVTWQKFQEYQRAILLGPEGNKTESIGIDDLIYDITNNKTGITPTMANVFRRADVLMAESYEMIGDNYWCKNKEQSPQQVLYNLYQLLELYALKAYALEQFATIGNYLWDKDPKYLEQLISSRKKYRSRVTSSLKVFSLPMTLPRDIWRCDPRVFVRGVNYEQFTRLLQGHIENEVDMSSRRTCRQTCDTYSYTRSFGCYDSGREFCQKTERCSGNIIGCFFVNSHASICVSESRDRRYDFVQFKNGVKYGETSSCSNKRSVHSWTRWFVRCHYCMCLCDQPGPLSDRYISLRPVKADIENNMVVTGMRLVKHNRILHIQIQTGQLLPYGYINQTSVSWIEVDDYKVTDRDAKEGIDFFQMTYAKRLMALDEIQANDDDYAVTGVGFKNINDKVHFHIHVNPFDWKTGRLGSDGHYIYETNNRERSKISIVRPDIPTKTDRNSEMVISGASKYVEFTHSDFEKDAAQTTIPFIDMQEVVNNPAVPLVGAGIYYKGRKGYGGFIAPRIKTYDYRQHWFDDMPEIGETFTVENKETVEAN